MEASTDAFGSSTAPLTWHDFLERMRQPSAAEFVKAIKSFLGSFENNPPDGERDSAAVQAFLGNMEVAFRAHSLWAGSSEEELESAGEEADLLTQTIKGKIFCFTLMGLEKYVMTKLFSRLFASLPEDVKADEQLYEKIALVQQFIRPENLDIKPTFQNETSWLLAQKELQKINMYKAPRDKLVCILSCCKVINNLLLNASIASNENPPGADEFLPVLIYVTIKANPPQLHSNLLYIQRYRCQTRLVSEAAYFFTNMLSAASFIMSIDAQALSMEEAEYEKNMELARTLLSGLSGVSETRQSNQNARPAAPGSQPVDGKQNLIPNKNQVSKSAPQFSSAQSQSGTRTEEPYVKDQLPKTPSVSDLENKGASILLKDDAAGQAFVSFPYLYSQAGNLTISDVEDLLNNYKELVFKYVCLAKGLGLPSPSEVSTKQDQNGNQSEKVEESVDIGEEKSSDLLQKVFPNTTDDSNEKLPVAQNSDSKLSEEDPTSSLTQTEEADKVSDR